MFSRKTVMILFVIILFISSIVLVSVSQKRDYSVIGSGQIGHYIVAPFQEFASWLIRTVENIWETYFFLTDTARKNEHLEKKIESLECRINTCIEIEKTNDRFRKLLALKKRLPYKSIAAEIIGKDPSPWFRSIVINKGKKDGIRKGMPVVVPKGVVGLVKEVSSGYASVLTIIDQNSAVDVLIQRSRARGIITGNLNAQCRMKYVLIKHDVLKGDDVISSGFDGVYPKGLKIGLVSEISKRKSGIFRDILVTPSVDFEKLEEVLVIVDNSNSLEQDADLESER